MGWVSSDEHGYVLLGLKCEAKQNWRKVEYKLRC
jgi:hypothetical protein